MLVFGDVLDESGPGILIPRGAGVDNLAGLDGGDAVFFGLKVGLGPQDPELQGLTAAGIFFSFQFFPVAGHVLSDDLQVGFVEGDGLIGDFPAFFGDIFGGSLSGRLGSRCFRLFGRSLGGQCGGRPTPGHFCGKGFSKFVGDENRFRVMGIVIPPLFFGPPDGCPEKSGGHAVDGHLFGEGSVEQRDFHLFADVDQFTIPGAGSFREGRDGGVVEPDEVMDDFPVVSAADPAAVIVGGGQFPADEAVAHAAFDGAFPGKGGVVALTAELNVIVFLTVGGVDFVDVEIPGKPHLPEFIVGIVELVLGACPASLGGEVVEEGFQEFLFLFIAILALCHKGPAVGRVSQVDEGFGHLVESFLA